jgi:hypothetical protein
MYPKFVNQVFRINEENGYYDYKIKNAHFKISNKLSINFLLRSATFSKQKVHAELTSRSCPKCDKKV